MHRSDPSSQKQSAFNTGRSVRRVLIDPMHDDASESSFHAQTSASDRAALELEREIAIEEYRQDKDAILSAIKDALKNRRYREAQDFIYKYRAVSKFDADFRVLAEMTAKGLEKEQAVSSLVTALEATPDDDYKVRLEICERILQKLPDHPQYQKERERCQKALRIEAPPPALVCAEDGHIFKSEADSGFGIFAKICFYWSIICNFIMGMGMAFTSEAEGVFVTCAVMIALTVAQGFLLFPSSKKKAYSIGTLIGKLVASSTLCTLAVIISALFCM